MKTLQKLMWGVLVGSLLAGVAGAEARKMAARPEPACAAGTERRAAAPCQQPDQGSSVYQAALSIPVPRIWSAGFI